MAFKYTAEEALTRWGVGAPSLARMEELLAVSWAQCVAYAPLPAPDYTSLFESALGDGVPEEDIPPGHREAHYVQAHNIWNATLKAPGAVTYGPDDMPIALHPLDWHVKQLLRPRTAVPKVR